MEVNMVIKEIPLLHEEDLDAQEKNSAIIKKLIENSKAAIMGVVELHNKPIFPYRYEISVILTINAWELAMKAYLMTYKPDVKVVDGDWSKEFLNCVNSVGEHLGKDFLPQKESIELLYKYRCDTIHFYGEGIELILYSLLRPNILHFADFLLNHFSIDLSSEANLIILPIGFKRFVSPIDFLAKHESEGSEPIKDFIKSIKASAKNLEDNGFQDGLLINYSMAVESVNRVKNADIVAGISRDGFSSTISVNKPTTIGGFTTDSNAPKVQIQETSLYDEKFNLTTEMLNKRLRAEIKGVKFGKEYNAIIKEIKENINLFKWRYLDTSPTPKGSRKPYYSEEGLEEIKRKLNLLKGDTV